MESLAVPIQGIAQGISNLGTHFSNFLTALNNFNTSVGTWFTNLGTSIGTWFTNLGTNLSTWFINLGSTVDIFKTSVGTWFTNLVTSLTNLLSYINPFNENFFGYKIIDLFMDLLETLFIPSDDIFDDLYLTIYNKFTFIFQIRDLFMQLFINFNYGDEVPSFNITYRGVTVGVIDFEPYLEYRSWLHGIILAISWVIFIRKQFNKIPSLIGGV